MAQPVVDILKSKGEDVLLYLADEVVAGKVKASMTLDAMGRTTFIYGEREFGPEDVEAAWFRRPNVFVPDAPDNVRLITLNRERRESQNSLWYSIPFERWMIPPAHLRDLQRDKVEQLRIARQFGFATPRTVVSNSWEEAFDSFGGEDVIVKLVNGTMFVDKEPHFLSTTIINAEKQKKIAHTSPFPGIWQEYIPKNKEWRVTVVGEKVFPTAIYTVSTAKADWRKHQFDGKSVRYALETLPADVEEKCLKIMKHMKLRYGAFDFIEKEDGTFIFLEVNLNGQYQWLVDELDIPIPEAIADELLAIKSEAFSLR